MRLVLLLLFLLSLSIACSGTISQQVPAVVGNGGSIVNVTLSLVPGERDVYVSVFPRTGITTQESIENAVSYAYALHGEEVNCDAMVRFERTASFIEGPSAGTAITVMTYALLENKTLRNDTVITGTVDYAGNVGPVGGLYEKAKGAVSIEADYFITPVENFYEMLLLKNVESQYGIRIIEAKHVNDVIAFMTENKSIEQEGLSSRKREIPVLEEYVNPDMEGFEGVAEAMIDLEHGILNSIVDVDTETEEVKEFFDNEIKRQSALVGQGYLFSAANEAFLNYIDLSTIKAILEDRADLLAKKEEISECLDRLPSVRKTESNFEWIVGAELRQQWASDKLGTEIDLDILQDEKFVMFNDLMYGHAWCHVAANLISAAPQGGKNIDEDLWKNLAKNRISEARSMEPTGTIASRLAIAEDSYNKGLYGAAIFDAVFVIETMQAEMDLAGGIDVEAEVAAMLNHRHRSLWGNIYQSHGAFLDEFNESATAYKTLLLAEGLEEATQEMIEATKEEEEVLDIYLVVLAATISMFLLFVLLILIIRRVHGSKRHRKTYRTRKKKSRS